MHDDGYELVVVDTSATITMAIRDVAVFADLVVIPVRPSPHDLRALGTTIDLVEEAGKPLVFVINAAAPRARITKEVAATLSLKGTVAPVTVHQRIGFAASMVDGRTVMETGEKSRSVEEIANLWDFLQGQLADRQTQWTTTFFDRVANLITGEVA